MRFIITAQAGASATPANPEQAADFGAIFDRYMAFNEELHRAGVLVASEGLNANARSAHVKVSNGKRIAVDGPFAETKELVGGFYLIDVDSLDEAIAWAKRCPTGLGIDDILEIRPLVGSGDLPPELVARAAAAAPNWSMTWRK